MELIHTNYGRWIVTEHIQRMEAEVKSVTASHYIACFFVVLTFFVLKIPTCHIGVKTFVSFDFDKFLWQGNVIRQVCPKYHVRHVAGIKSGYPGANGS